MNINALPQRGRRAKASPGQSESSPRGRKRRRGGAGKTPVQAGSAALGREALRLLAALGRPGAGARPDLLDDAMVAVQASRGGVSVGAGRFTAAAADELVRQDLTVWESETGGRRLRLSEPGRLHLRRQADGTPDSFLAQHLETAVAEVGTGPDRVEVRIDADESPLAWLRRRKGRDGEPLIDATAFEAGERLRRDLTLAGLMPSVTMRWDPAGGGGSGGAGRDPGSATDAAIAARQRTAHAFEAVGPDFADLLIDLCGFLKGLELIERERHWPQRSGKVVARLALGRLADHYGLARAARGPSASRGIRSWQALGMLDACPA